MSARTGALSLAYSLDSIRKQVRELIIRRSTRVWVGMFALKVLILVLTGVIGYSQFADSTPGQPVSEWKIYGRAAAIGLFFVAFITLFVDGDSAAELRTATRALDKAKDLERLRPKLAAADLYANRISHLFLSLKVIRGVQEQALLHGLHDEMRLVQLIFELTKFSMPIAINFRPSDQWTVCVYRADRSAGSPDILRCIAHNRAIECDIANARPWQEGVGVAGVSYANCREVIVPDLRAGNLGNLFNVGSRERSYDEARYRSFAVVPITLGTADKPWGVVVATSSTPYHFTLEMGTGITTAEAVRTLAEAIALTVACCRPAASAAPPGNHP